MFWDQYTSLCKAEINFLRATAKKLPKNGHVLAAGVWKGGDVMAMYNIRPDLKFTVLDSFEGLADPLKEDHCEDVCLAGEFDQGGIENFIDGFKAVNIFNTINMNAKKIWITENTLRPMKRTPIDFLWLDLDHYGPTIACLKKFGPQTKGLIATHDFKYERCPGIEKACLEYHPKWKKVEHTGIGFLV